MFWFPISITLCAIGGFLLASYIKKQKHSEEHLVCPIGGACHTLVNGRFSRFLGVPVENLGMVYYGLIAVIYLASLVRGVPDWVMLVGLLASGIGFAFSMYLTIIQVFVVKKWCTLCLGSAAISFLIVVLSFLGYEATFAEFAYTHRDLLKWIYALALLVGTFVTTIHARTFVRFLRDFRISRKEERRLEMLSHTAWMAIGFAFLSGLGLAMTDRWREYVDSNAFIVMVVILGVLIVYEVVLNMIVSPRLVGMHFGDEVQLEDHQHSYYRKAAFAFVGLGVVSWYAMLLLSGFNWFQYSSGELFVGYIILVLIATGVTL